MFIFSLPNIMMFTQIIFGVGYIQSGNLFPEPLTQDEEKIYLLNNIISSLGNTLFSQTLLSEFEHTMITEIESGKALNAENLKELYKEKFKEYYGETIIVDVDNSYEWTRIPHLMMNQAYYLYQYPIGLSIALEIARRIMLIPSFKEKYISFLKIGNSKNVIQSLEVLDIDLRNKDYLENSYKYFEDKVELLIKIKKNQK